MDLEYRIEEHAGITLVEAELSNPHRRARYVEVVSALDGPVLPPRESGYPADGWDDTGYRGTVEAGACLVLGYASPAPPADPPLTIESVEASPDDRTTRSPGGIVRSLGDPRPPTDALADAERGASEQRSNAEVGGESTMPPAIGAWFDAVATRLDGDDAVDTDRLAAVAERATELHRRSRQ